MNEHTMINDNRLLAVHNLCGMRNEQCLFSGISFLLYPEMVLQIAGKNGCGKTSLLRTLCGLLPFASGQINWYHPYLYLGHRLALQTQLTVAENLHFYCDLFRNKSSPAETTQKINAVLTELQLLAYADDAVQQLSAGQQKRLQLARLWFAPNTVWILDEPFTALDAQLIQLCREKIIQHCKAGGAVIITSHQTLMLSSIAIQQLELWS